MASTFSPEQLADGDEQGDEEVTFGGAASIGPSSIFQVRKHLFDTPLAPEDGVAPTVNAAAPTAPGLTVAGKKGGPVPVNQEKSAGGENLKVFLRVRPLGASEVAAEAGQEPCLAVQDEKHVVLQPPRDRDGLLATTGKTSATTRVADISTIPFSYTFSKVFEQGSTQKTFFDETTLPLVRDVLQGKNCLLFTYGITNSGKTFTIQVRCLTSKYFCWRLLFDLALCTRHSSLPTQFAPRVPPSTVTTVHVWHRPLCPTLIFLFYPCSPF